MELKDLYKKLIVEGCNDFFIVGTGGPKNDDVECLDLVDGNWQVYYIERGQKSKPSYTSNNKQEAIQYYHDYILSKEHWHIVAFTRSEEKFQKTKSKIEANGVNTIQNDIPHYKRNGDHVYRLYVVNKDIFKVRKILRKVPIKDMFI